MIVSPTTEIQVGPQCSTALFRIVQEALTNAVRHAEASAMHVRVRREDGFAVVEISDNGKGMEAAQLFAQQSWGIAGMNERARHFGGDLTVTGTPGAGLRLANSRQRRRAARRRFGSASFMVAGRV